MVAKVATRNRDQVARARSAKKTAGRNVVARQLAPLSAVGAASHFCFAFPAHTSIITLSGMEEAARGESFLTVSGVEGAWQINYSTRF
jgi:hypothetical protein